jgi:Na+/proline symporter/CheY-like chemotaxis protein
MLFGWVVVGAALVTIGLLFAIAHWADERASREGPRGRPIIYALSLGVYCTSWTYYGSVGLAATRGLDFLTIYIGPVILFAAFYPLLIRIVRIAKQQNITSLADFVAARYGKNQAVAAVVTFICAVGALPYIALQLKAISGSLGAVLAGPTPSANALSLPIVGDMSLVVALSLAAFAILFGTRHIDATEHQHGLMVAVAAESVVKLVAFIAVGLFVTFALFDGPYDLFARAAAIPGALAPLLRPPEGGLWITMTGLAFIAGLLLPRMFHTIVVENTSERDIRRGAWLFPIYLVAINLFVVPIAIAGVVSFGVVGTDTDTLVLALPLAANSPGFTLVAFIGGLSAATAMVIVETVALSIMIGNEVVMPILLRRRAARGVDGHDMGRVVLTIRRISIIVVIMLGYAYYQMAAANQQLVSIGLISFAAIAQLAPTFFGGLVWRRATANGAVAGMLTGFFIWFYTLLLPSFTVSGLVDHGLLTDGPFGIGALRPQALFGVAFDSLSHGVFWSLLGNITAYVVVSLLRAPRSTEALQAGVFIDQAQLPMGPGFGLWRTAVTVQDLQDTVSRYLGQERTESSFRNFARNLGVTLDPQAEADIQLLRHSEHLLASAVGAASSRLVLSLLLRRRNVSTKAAMRLLDDASAAIQYNRDLLQTALDQVGQAIVVTDRDLRMITWNGRFQALLDLPPEVVQIGVHMGDVVRHLAERGEFGPGTADALVGPNLVAFLAPGKSHRRRLERAGITIEVRTARMPDGGFVTTFADVTETVRSAQELERANETLENRVRERTEQLVRLNEELARAKAEADEANLSKTRFLAAAGHDILQPLNAARLYVTSLVERDVPPEEHRLARNIDHALEAVEEIIGALLDISRLDAGALRAETSIFPMDELLRQLEVEFAPLAREKGLSFRIVPTALFVRSDRRLLRRLLQNLVSNAIKYTPRGRVLVGCRRRGDTLSIQVWDTGLGIPANKRRTIFREFQRLEQGAKAARGLGLGLSIVERLGRVLDHPIGLVSEPGRGSMFSIELPIAPSVPRLKVDPAAPAPRVARLDGLTVVCIDNEEAILDGMAKLLSGWGVTVIKASNARRAIEAVRAAMHGPDAVIADYHLDEGNGLDAVEELRRAFGRELPAVLITADRSPTVREAATATSVMLLNKPLKPAALRAVLAQWRARRAAAE